MDFSLTGKIGEKWPIKTRGKNGPKPDVRPFLSFLEASFPNLRPKPIFHPFFSCFGPILWMLTVFAKGFPCAPAVICFFNF